MSALRGRRREVPELAAIVGECVGQEIGSAHEWKIFGWGGAEVAVLVRDLGSGIGHLTFELVRAAVLNRLAQICSHHAGDDGDVGVQERDVTDMVHVGMRKEDRVGPELAIVRRAFGPLPDAAGWILEVGAVDAAQGRQQTHLDQVDQAGAGAWGQKFFEVAGPGLEGRAEIEEDGAVAVFEQDLIAADRVRAVVDGDCWSTQSVQSSQSRFLSSRAPEGAWRSPFTEIASGLRPSQ